MSTEGKLRCDSPTYGVLLNLFTNLLISSTVMQQSF